MKVGAVNLTVQFEREFTPKMKEAVLGCLSNFLKGSNFAGKRQFISELDGLKLLSQWICVSGDQEKAMNGQGLDLRKIRFKLLTLLHDFLSNDDSILYDGYYVRDTYGRDTNLLNSLLKNIKYADIEK